MQSTWPIITDMGAMGLEPRNGKKPKDDTLRKQKTADSQTRFLVAFAECGIITQACKWAKIQRVTYWRWMQDDPTFPPRFESARREAAQGLEDEIIRRARYGVSKPVLYKGKRVFVDGRPLYETTKSDILLIRAAEANHPRYKKDNKVEIVQTDAGRIGAKLAEVLTPQELADLERRIEEHQKRKLANVESQTSQATEVENYPALASAVHSEEQENTIAPPDESEKEPSEN